MLCLLVQSGFAQDDVERTGYFEVRSATTSMVGGVHTLDARLQLVLSSEALEALSSGVPLTIELQLELIRVRRFVWDDAAAELALRYELEYRPLSQRYIVRNRNSGDQDSFATLYSALNNLGRVQGLPIIDDALLEADKKYRVRLRAMLNTQQYPAPLRLLFFWRDQWQLKSEWVGLVVVALFLLSRTAQNSDDFDRLHNVILAINIAGVVVLFIFLVGNLVRLLREYRTHVPGAKLKARIVGMFVGLAVLPLLVVFYFSIQFINRGIDTWFNVEVEAGLENALKLSRAVLEMQMRQHLYATQQISQRLSDVNERQLIFELSMMRRESGASEITIYASNNQILATSSDSSSARLPRPLAEEVLLQMQQDRPYVSLDPEDFEIRTAVLFSKRGRAEPIGVLQAHFPVAERLARMANSVDTSYREYQQLMFLREPLKSTFTLTLSVVLMLSLLAAIYGAFILSRRLVAPIQDLVAGTRAVA